jgi:predicted small lipoprotein YifL
MKYTLIILCILGLTACGKKGPLEPKPAKSNIETRSTAHAELVEAY